MATRSSAYPWLKPTVDYGPLAVFFAGYLLYDLIVATALLIVATLVALLVSWLLERRLPMVALVTAGVVTVFGGLTLALNDETFIKMKPTIVQAAFAAILLGGLVFNRPLLKPLLGTAWALDDAGWSKLSFRFALFFVAMAALNELVWRTQSTDFWVNFKVFGILALTMLFVLSQVVFLRTHTIEEQDGPAEGGG